MILNVFAYVICHPYILFSEISSCVFLFNGTLSNIYHRCINIELIAHSTNSVNMCDFSIKHITTFLYLEMLDITSPLCLSAILNSDITNKKHKIVENVTLNIPQKEHLFTV